jgi:PAS domain S-box-containing protein
MAGAADFEEMVDTSPAMLWTTDRDGLCTYLSRQWYEFTGRTPEQDLGKGWLEVVHPDDRARTADAFLAAQARHEPFRFDYRLRRRDGVYRWAMDAGFPRFDEAGAFVGFVGNVIDVHERNALENRFRSVARAVGLGVWYCDLPFSELIWDSTVKEHFYLPHDARVTIETFYERIHPEDRERTRQAIDHSIANHAPYDIHYRTTHPATGVIKHIRAIGWTDYDDRGTPIRFDGVTLDVTDEVEAQRQLQETRVRYEHATRATKHAIWDWDLATQTVEWNEALHAQLGHPREALRSTSGWWVDHVHPDDRDAVFESIHATIDSIGEQFWSAEYRFRRGDGTYASVFDRGFVVRDGGGRPLRMIGAMEDVTSRKEVEQALRAAIRTRDEFLSIASHELKTPLTSLKLHGELLARALGQEVDRARAQRIVGQSAKQIDRLSVLVDDMLDVSRIATGKLSLLRETVSIAQLAAEVVEAFRPQFERHGAAIDLQADAVHARVDRARLEQVLVNLVGNALKYGAAKPVRVRVDQRDGCARIEVTDEGIGISREHHERVFARFERAVPANGITGLGLGLFISKQIVEMHGGKISVESEPGRGSTFTVMLPADETHRRSDPG